MACSPAGMSACHGQDHGTRHCLCPPPVAPALQVGWRGMAYGPAVAAALCEATVLAAGAAGGSQHLARRCWRKPPRHVTELQPRATSTTNTLLCRLGAARSAPPPSPSRQEMAGSHPHFKEGEPLPPSRIPWVPPAPRFAPTLTLGAPIPAGCRAWGKVRTTHQHGHGGQQWQGLTAGSAGPKPCGTQPHICPTSAPAPAPSCPCSASHGQPRLS